MASSELKDGKRYRTREGRILEAVIAVADADAEDETSYHRAWVRFRKTMIECGWRPPVEPQHRKPSMLANQLAMPWNAKPVPTPRPK